MGPVVTRPFTPQSDIYADSSAAPEVKLLVKLATALQHYGAPAHRLERTCLAVAETVGLQAHFFSTPTAVFASFGDLDAQRTFLLRANSGEIHLERLRQLDWIIGELAGKRVEVNQALAYLNDLVDAEERFGPVLTTLCFGVASATACRFLGGGLPEIAVAGLIGIMIGCLAILAMRRAAVGNVLMPVSAIIASLTATFAASVVPGFEPYSASVAGLIVLVPGLSFTTAMVELATGHLASGTARLAKATSMFLLMAFGIALGVELGRFFPPATESGMTMDLPMWTEWLALALATPAFAVLFRAHPKDFIWVILAGPLAFYGARFGGLVLGPELGGFIAAFMLGVTANLFARWKRRPSAIVLEPGIIFLVPGTIGLKSISFMVADDPLLGVDTAFSMLLIAMALVIGILFAHVVVPPRREL